MLNLPTVWLLAAALIAQPQAAPPSDRAAVPAAFKALHEGRYLQAVVQARDAAFTGGALDRSRAGYSTWLQLHPFVGGTLDSAAIEPGPFSRALNVESADRYRRAEVRDAVREIVARARNTRIVILNEAHHSPRDRAFGLEVARALRPLGYNMLAAEAVWPASLSSSRLDYV